MRLTAMVLAFVVATTWPAVAPAEHPSVRKAQRAYKQLRFEDVLREVAEARKSPLDPADDLELTRLEAYTYAVYDDAQRSVDAFSRLLTLQPSWVLPPDTSPKIRRYFLDAKRKRRAARLLEEPIPGEVEDLTPPFYASGWFWGGLLGAVAAGVGLGLWAAHREPGTPRGNLGTVELP